MKTIQKQPLILASASPRRREILTQAGITFEVFASSTNEEVFLGEESSQAAMRLALEKAVAVAKVKFQNSGQIVLGADTIVVLDEKILGKPKNRTEATLFLRELSGRTHRVITGYTLVQISGTILVQDFSETAVSFRELNEDEINAYVQSGEGLDKAGGYAIQGGAKSFVTSIQGSLSNVIGLPIEDLLPWFFKLGLINESRKDKS